MTDATSYKCPVEGCKYGEQEDKTLAQVRGHVNSSGDEDHVWQEAKHELLAEAEKREVKTASEDGGSDSEKEVEEDDDQSGGDGEDSTEMATQEEYEEQYSDEDGDLPEGESEDESGQPADGDGDQDGGSGFTVPAVSASTVVLVAGVVVAALLVWKLYSGSDAASDYEAPEEQADPDGDDEDGGMAAIEAGTGGVQV